MNLGIYVPTLANHEQLMDISKSINENIGSKLSDASIFYDNIAYNPFKISCGVFNSTDLWNFKGTLITTSLQTTIKSTKIVNDITIYYYYGFETATDPLSLIYLKNNQIKFIAKDSNSKNDFFRKTAEPVDFVASSFSEIVKELTK
jgi:hypothetical protein